MTFGEASSLHWNISMGFSNRNDIFRTMSENRKRSLEDDTCEFMPLSKRINNLHINNNLTSASTSQTSSSSSQHNGLNNIDNGISSPNTDLSPNTERRPNYDPGVNCTQSIYFYENKLLFELHLERIQRSGQQFPF